MRYWSGLALILFSCYSMVIWAQAPTRPAVLAPVPRAPAVLAPSPIVRPIPQPNHAQLDPATAPSATPPSLNKNPSVADRPRYLPETNAPQRDTLQQPFSWPKISDQTDRETIAPATEMTPELIQLREKINETLAIYEQRHQNTRDNTNWEVMHAFVAFNAKTQIRRYGPTGTPVNAIGWVLWGQPCNGQSLLTLYNGRPRAEIGVGVQGHPGQLLSILAQSRISIETPIKVQGRDFTLRDLLEEEMLDCRPNTELTFRLSAFSHYLDLNKTWVASDGQHWSIPRIIQEELKAPIRGAACGGTHRLFGLTYAYQQRLKRGEPLDGEYLKAKQYIENYQRYAWSLMNPDGSFSTEWFWRAGNRPDMDRKIQTTGHLMEWMILSQTDQELRSPRMIKSIDLIATNLRANPRHEWKLGPMGHALHSLMMYNERVFKAPKVPAEMVAKQPSKTTKLDGTGKQPRAQSPSDDKVEITDLPVKNPFDDDPTEIVDDPKTTAPENLEPLKTKSDQGQSDETPGPEPKANTTNEPAAEDKPTRIILDEPNTAKIKLD